ncbi:WbqC family protein [Spirosoma montaniterrae]|uniref:WbqC-like protein n=1 Tax=Spirosoma montaniterrae TaxID=1178516 RepID=A0A1P9WWS5_9BACT|nr:WbqC family protein [Spirosoma montaniterrae]AQG79768.1 hypothetical protein AWR27_10795 [Spirosoma montaniterrae]
MEKYQLESSSASLLIELHYLPCFDYMTGLLQFERVWLEANEHYQKQSYRNRCYVLTANKVDTLTVPVQKGTRHQPIRDLRIDNDQRWQAHHWRCLQGAYGKAPFFEYYAPELEPVYRKSWTYLFELNQELLTICLRLLGAAPSINLTDCYRKEVSPGIFDARSAINPPNEAESYVFGRSVPYQQNFGQEFVPNLSVLDLLFCQGPMAREVLTLSLFDPGEQINKTLR